MCATQQRASDRMACGMLSVPHSRWRKCLAAHGLLAHSSRPVVTKPVDNASFDVEELQPAKLESDRALASGKLCKGVRLAVNGLRSCACEAAVLCAPGTITTGCLGRKPSLRSLTPMRSVLLVDMPRIVKLDSTCSGSASSFQHVKPSSLSAPGLHSPGTMLTSAVLGAVDVKTVIT
jgi:hypothetical protein